VGVVKVTKRKGAREKSVSKLNVRDHLGLIIWLISQFSRASSDFLCDCVILVLGSVSTVVTMLVFGCVKSNS